MEQDHYARYSQQVAQCRDIATEIHPHCREMFPGGFNEMSALDPDLSAAPLTVKMDFRERNLETLRKLQRKILSSATAGMVEGPLDTTGQQPTKSSSAPTHLPPSSSPMRPVLTPPPEFLNGWKTSTKGRQYTDRAQFGNSASEKCGAMRV